MTGEPEMLARIRQQFAFVDGSAPITGLAADVHKLLDIIDARDAEITRLQAQNSSYYWSEEWLKASKEVEFLRAELAALRREKHDNQ